MSIVLANITAGAYHGSGFVTITAALPDSTAVVLYRGTLLLGSGLLASGSVVIPVAPLATGDVIQASVTERGNQSGEPVMVFDTANPPTGWRIPATVQVSNPDGTTSTLTAAQYEAQTGIKPAAVYDPSLIVSVIAPDPETIAQTTVSGSVIVFGLKIEQQVGQTVVTVQSVLNQNGNVLVRWASTEGFGNTLSRTYTAASTITINVKGDNDTVYASQTISVAIFSPPTSTPAASDIAGVAWRQLGSANFVRVFIDSLKSCECRLEGFDMTWQTGVFYGINPDYQEGGFYPVPPGNYTIWVRVAGDTDSTRWKSLAIDPF